MAPLPVDIWSDVVCPWCHVGKQRFEEALARFEHADEVEVTWHAFELNPDAPRLGDGTRPPNTFDAHRLIHLAATHGRQGEMMERLMRGHFSEGEQIGDREALARMAADVGLSEHEARTALAGGRYSAEVREDERVARQIGIRGVPFFVLDRRFGVSGAQPAEAQLEALERAWAARADTAAA